ncbi:MAG: hypothetical protein Q8R76_00250 [Candidatus Omnitrophota bacterium]|nr:hypothetical protein [Candidatus Omnitrophota bacterium]
MGFRHKRTHPTIKKIIACALLICFTAFSVAAPASAASMAGVAAHPSLGDLTSLSVPKEFGTIERIFIPAGGSRHAPVLYIQNAHTNYDSEIHVSRLIEHFRKKYDLPLVMLEGGEGRLDNLFFRSFPDAEVKEKVLREYISKGELSGGEMAAVTDDFGVTDYIGIEDRKLYERNKQAYLKAIAAEDEVLDLLWRIDDELYKRSQTIFSEETKTFWTSQRNFHSDYLDFIEYLSVAAAIWKTLRKEPIAYTYPQLGRLLALEFEQKRYKAGEIDLALRNLIREFQKGILTTLSSYEQMDLNEGIQDYLTNQRQAAELVQKFVETAERHGREFPLPPALQPGAMQARTLASIKGTVLFDELRDLEALIRAELPKSDAERRLLDDLFHLDLLDQLAHLELVPREWNRIRASKPSALIKSPTDSGDLTKLDRLYNAHYRFYELAEERDGALFANMERTAAEHRAGLSAVVTGGFHAASITQQLEAAGIPFALILPKIETIDDDSSYRNVMQGKRSYTERFGANLWDALAQDYAAKIAATLKPADLTPSLKQWRDRIIQNAIAEKRITSAGQYTRYVDALVQSLRRKFAEKGDFAADEVSAEELRGLIDKELNNFLPVYFERFRAHLKRKALVFEMGLKEIWVSGDISAEKIGGLFDRLHAGGTSNLAPDIALIPARQPPSTPPSATPRLSSTEIREKAIELERIAAEQGLTPEEFAGALEAYDAILSAEEGIIAGTPAALIRDTIRSVPNTSDAVTILTEARRRNGTREGRFTIETIPLDQAAAEDGRAGRFTIETVPLGKATIEVFPVAAAVPPAPPGPPSEPPGGGSGTFNFPEIPDGFNTSSLIKEVLLPGRPVSASRAAEPESPHAGELRGEIEDLLSELEEAKQKDKLAYERKLKEIAGRLHVLMIYLYLELYGPWVDAKELFLKPPGPQTGIEWELLLEGPEEISFTELLKRLLAASLAGAYTADPQRSELRIIPSAGLDFSGQLRLRGALEVFVQALQNPAPITALTQNEFAAGEFSFLLRSDGIISIADYGSADQAKQTQTQFREIGFIEDRGGPAQTAIRSLIEEGKRIVHERPELHRNFTGIADALRQKTALRDDNTSGLSPPVVSVSPTFQRRTLSEALRYQAGVESNRNNARRAREQLEQLTENQKNEIIGIHTLYGELAPGEGEFFRGSTLEVKNTSEIPEIADLAKAQNLPDVPVVIIRLSAEALKRLKQSGKISGAGISVHNVPGAVAIQGALARKGFGAFNIGAIITPQSHFGYSPTEREFHELGHNIALGKTADLGRTATPFIVRPGGEVDTLEELSNYRLMYAGADGQINRVDQFGRPLKTYEGKRGLVTGYARSAKQRRELERMMDIVARLDSIFPHRYVTHLLLRARSHEEVLGWTVDEAGRELSDEALVERFLEHFTLEELLRAKKAGYDPNQIALLDLDDQAREREYIRGDLANPTTENIQRWADQWAVGPVTYLVETGRRSELRLLQGWLSAETTDPILYNAAVSALNRLGLTPADIAARLAPIEESGADLQPDINISNQGVREQSVHPATNAEFRAQLDEKYRKQELAKGRPLAVINAEILAAGVSGAALAIQPDAVTTNEFGETENVFFLDGLAEDRQIGHAGLTRNQVYAKTGRYDIAAHELAELRLWKIKERELIERGEIDPSATPASGTPRNIREWIRANITEARRLDAQFHAIGLKAEAAARAQKVKTADHLSRVVYQVIGKALYEVPVTAAKAELDKVQKQYELLKNSGLKGEAFQVELKLKETELADAAKKFQQAHEKWFTYQILQSPNGANRLKGLLRKIGIDVKPGDTRSGLTLLEAFSLNPEVRAIYDKVTAALAAHESELQAALEIDSEDKIETREHLEKLRALGEKVRGELERDLAGTDTELLSIIIPTAVSEWITGFSLLDESGQNVRAGAQADLIGQGRANFIVAVALYLGFDISAPTGIGKTTGMRLGAAIAKYADPNTSVGMFLENTDSEGKDYVKVKKGGQYDGSRQRKVGADADYAKGVTGLEFAALNGYDVIRASDYIGEGKEDYAGLHEQLKSNPRAVLVIDVFNASQLGNQFDRLSESGKLDAVDLYEYIEAMDVKIVDEAQIPALHRVRSIIAKGGDAQLEGRRKIVRRGLNAAKVLDRLREEGEFVEAEDIEDFLQYLSDGTLKETPAYVVTDEGIELNRALTELLRKNLKKYGFTRQREFRSLLQALYAPSESLMPGIIEGRIELKPFQEDKGTIEKRQQSSDVALQVGALYRFFKQVAAENEARAKNAPQVIEEIKTQLESMRTPANTAAINRLKANLDRLKAGHNEKLYNQIAAQIEALRDSANKTVIDGLSEDLRKAGPVRVRDVVQDLESTDNRIDGEKAGDKILSGDEIVEGVDLKPGSKAKTEVNYEKLGNFFKVESIGRLDTKTGTPIQELFGSGVRTLSATLPLTNELYTGNPLIDLGTSRPDLELYKEAGRLHLGTLDFDSDEDIEKLLSLLKSRDVLRSGDESKGELAVKPLIVIPLVKYQGRLRERLEEYLKQHPDLAADLGYTADAVRNIIREVGVTTTSEAVQEIEGEGLYSQGFVVIGPSRIATGRDFKGIISVIGLGIENYPADLLAQLIGRDRQNRGQIHLYGATEGLRRNLVQSIAGAEATDMERFLARQLKILERELADTETRTETEFDAAKARNAKFAVSGNRKDLGHDALVIDKISKALDGTVDGKPGSPALRTSANEAVIDRIKQNLGNLLAAVDAVSVKDLVNKINADFGTLQGLSPAEAKINLEKLQAYAGNIQRVFLVTRVGQQTTRRDEGKRHILLHRVLRQKYDQSKMGSEEFQDLLEKLAKSADQKITLEYKDEAKGETPESTTSTEFRLSDFYGLNFQYRYLMVQSHASRFVATTMSRNEVVTRPLKSLVSQLINGTGQAAALSVPERQKAVAYLSELIKEIEEGKVFDVDSYLERGVISGEDYVRNELLMQINFVLGEDLENDRGVLERLRGQKIFRSIWSLVEDTLRVTELREVKQALKTKEFKLESVQAEAKLSAEQGFPGKFSIASTKDKSLRNLFKTLVLFSEYVAAGHRHRSPSSEQGERAYAQTAKEETNRDRGYQRSLGDVLEDSTKTRETTEKLKNRSELRGGRVSRAALNFKRFLEQLKKRLETDTEQTTAALNRLRRGIRADNPAFIKDDCAGGTSCADLAYAVAHELLDQGVFADPQQGSTVAGRALGFFDSLSDTEAAAVRFPDFLSALRADHPEAALARLKLLYKGALNPAEEAAANAAFDTEAEAERYKRVRTKLAKRKSVYDEKVSKQSEFLRFRGGLRGVLDNIRYYLNLSQAVKGVLSFELGLSGLRNSLRTRGWKGLYSKFFQPFFGGSRNLFGIIRVNAITVADVYNGSGADLEQTLRQLRSQVPDLEEADLDILRDRWGDLDSTLRNLLMNMSVEDLPRFLRALKAVEKEAGEEGFAKDRGRVIRDAYRVAFEKEPDSAGAEFRRTLVSVFKVGLVVAATIALTVALPLGLLYAAGLLGVAGAFQIVSLAVTYGLLNTPFGAKLFKDKKEGLLALLNQPEGTLAGTLLKWTVFLPKSTAKAFLNKKFTQSGKRLKRLSKLEDLIERAKKGYFKPSAVSLLRVIKLHYAEKGCEGNACAALDALVSDFDGETGYANGQTIPDTFKSFSIADIDGTLGTPSKLAEIWTGISDIADNVLASDARVAAFTLEELEKLAARHGLDDHVWDLARQFDNSLETPGADLLQAIKDSGTARSQIHLSEFRELAKASRAVALLAAPTEDDLLTVGENFLLTPTSLKILARQAGLTVDAATFTQKLLDRGKAAGRQAQRRALAKTRIAQAIETLKEAERVPAADRGAKRAEAASLLDKAFRADPDQGKRIAEVELDFRLAGGYDYVYKALRGMIDTMREDLRVNRAHYTAEEIKGLEIQLALLEKRHKAGNKIVIASNLDAAALNRGGEIHLNRNLLIAMNRLRRDPKLGKDAETIVQATIGFFLQHEETEGRLDMLDRQVIIRQLVQFQITEASRALTPAEKTERDRLLHIHRLIGHGDGKSTHRGANDFGKAFRDYAANYYEMLYTRTLTNAQREGVYTAFEGLAALWHQPNFLDKITPYRRFADGGTDVSPFEIARQRRRERIKVVNDLRALKAKERAALSGGPVLTAAEEAERGRLEKERQQPLWNEKTSPVRIFNDYFRHNSVFGYAFAFKKAVNDGLIKRAKEILEAEKKKNFDDDRRPLAEPNISQAMIDDLEALLRNVAGKNEAERKAEVSKWWENVENSALKLFSLYTQYNHDVVGDLVAGEAAKVADEIEAGFKPDASGVVDPVKLAAAREKFVVDASGTPILENTIRNILGPGFINVDPFSDGFYKVEEQVKERILKTIFQYGDDNDRKLVQKLAKRSPGSRRTLDYYLKSFSLAAMLEDAESHEKTAPAAKTDAQRFIESNLQEPGAFAVTPGLSAADAQIIADTVRAARTANETAYLVLTGVTDSQRDIPEVLLDELNKIGFETSLAQFKRGENVYLSFQGALPERIEPFGSHGYTSTDIQVTHFHPSDDPTPSSITDAPGSGSSKIIARTRASTYSTHESSHPDVTGHSPVGDAFDPAKHQQIVFYEDDSGNKVYDVFEETSPDPYSGFQSYAPEFTDLIRRLRTDNKAYTFYIKDNRPGSTPTDWLKSQYYIPGTSRSELRQSVAADKVSPDAVDTSVSRAVSIVGNAVAGDALVRLGLAADTVLYDDDEVAAALKVLYDRGLSAEDVAGLTRPVIENAVNRALGDLRQRLSEPERRGAVLDDLGTRLASFDTTLPAPEALWHAFVDASGLIAVENPDFTELSGWVDSVRNLMRYSAAVSTEGGALGLSLDNLTQADVARARAIKDAILANKENRIISYQISNDLINSANRRELIEELAVTVRNTVMLRPNYYIRIIVPTIADQDELREIFGRLANESDLEIITPSHVYLTSTEAQPNILEVFTPSHIVITDDAEIHANKIGDAAALASDRFVDGSVRIRYTGDLKVTPSELLLAAIASLTEETLDQLVRYDNGLIRARNRTALTSFALAAQMLAQEFREQILQARSA